MSRAIEVDERFKVDDYERLTTNILTQGFKPSPRIEQREKLWDTSDLYYINQRKLIRLRWEYIAKDEKYSKGEFSYKSEPLENESTIRQDVSLKNLSLDDMGNLEKLLNKEIQLNGAEPLVEIQKMVRKPFEIIDAEMIKEVTAIFTREDLKVAISYSKFRDLYSKKLAAFGELTLELDYIPNLEGSIHGTYFLQPSIELKPEDEYLIRHAKYVVFETAREIGLPKEDYHYPILIVDMLFNHLKGKPIRSSTPNPALPQ